MNKPECNGCDCQDVCAESMRNPSILFTSPRCKHKKSFYVCLEMSEKSMAERTITLIGDSGAGKLPLIFHRGYDTVIAPIDTRNESMNNELGKIWCEIVELAKNILIWLKSRVLTIPRIALIIRLICFEIIENLVGAI